MDTFRSSPVVRLALLAFALVLSAFLLSFMAASIVFSPGVAVRALAWGRADVNDHLKFPSRALAPSGSPFRFLTGEDVSTVRRLFEADPRIDDLGEFLASTRTLAFIVIQDDKVLFEKYFNGAQRDSIVTSFSVAKSVTSALIGIAIGDGAIQSVNDPITAYIPELFERDSRFADITIRDLLLMSSGLRYIDALPYGDDVRTYLHPDLRSQALSMTEIVDPPGKYFHYNNYNPLLLGMILERATGMPVASYLELKLWGPLGMEFEGSWSLDSQRSGFEKMESGINGRAIDFAKFGRLYLNQGVWEGVPIVPKSWVYESTQEDTSRDQAGYYADTFGKRIFHTREGGYYRYLWYGLYRDGEMNDFFAEGNKGQYVYLCPAKRLILVRHGEDYGVDPFDWIEIFYQFASRIEPG